MMAVATVHAAELRQGIALPKLGVTESIIVVDVAADKANGGNDFCTDSHDVLAAITVFQGLINRSSAEKIYLTNMPCRLYWNPERVGGEADAASLWLEDGLVPCKRTTAQFDPTRKYPALSYLLARYGHLLKGKIVAPPEENPWPAGVAEFHRMYNDKSIKARFTTTGARIAALTACGFEDALLVTPAIDAYLKAEGFDLPLIADTRGMDRIGAFTWMRDRYLDHPLRNRRMIAFHDNKSFLSPNMHDYWVATRTFCVFLLQKESPAEKQLLESLLTLEHFDAGAPFFGSIESSGAGKMGTQSHFPPVYGCTINATVTSSFELPPERFGKPAATKAPERVDPNGIYIQFIGSDGDAVDFMQGFIYKDLRAKTDSTPSAFRINAYMIDLFPTMVAWFLQQQSAKNIDIVYNSIDGGIPESDAGVAAFNQHYRAYAAAVDAGNFRLHHFFEGVGNAKRERALAGVDVDLVICGYKGPPNKSKRQYLPQLRLTGSTVELAQIGQNYLNAPGIVDYVVEAAKYAVDGEPLFLPVRGGQAQGIGTSAIFDAAARALRRRDWGGRTLYIVRPAEFAATYRLWIQQKGADQ